jgi:uncharacterized protein
VFYSGGGLSGSWSWLLILIVPIAIGALTQFWVKRQYSRFSGVPIASGQTGAEAARTILDGEGLQSVSIREVPGELTDNYDPRTNVLNLSKGVYEGRSIASAGVAAHEAGHAVQHARHYGFAAVRGALVPAANIGSQAAPFLIIVGIILRFTGLAWLGIVLYAGAVLFQVVTLPVELDASRRALKVLVPAGVVTDAELPGARSVLTAAAMTYVAAALISVIYLLYYIGLARRN